MDSPTLDSRLADLSVKLDAVLSRLNAAPDPKAYLSAKDVGALVGLDARTILNRSNLPSEDARYIPSLRFGSKRKYFDRRVVVRLFRVVEG